MWLGTNSANNVVKAVVSSPKSEGGFQEFTFPVEADVGKLISVNLNTLQVGNNVLIHGVNPKKSSNSLDGSTKPFSAELLAQIAKREAILAEGELAYWYPFENTVGPGSTKEEIIAQGLKMTAYRNLQLAKMGDSGLARENFINLTPDPIDDYKNNSIDLEQPVLKLSLEADGSVSLVKAAAATLEAKRRPAYLHTEILTSFFGLFDVGPVMFTRVYQAYGTQKKEVGVGDVYAIMLYVSFSGYNIENENRPYYPAFYYYAFYPDGGFGGGSYMDEGFEPNYFIPLDTNFSNVHVSNYHFNVAQSWAVEEPYTHVIYDSRSLFTKAGEVSDQKQEATVNLVTQKSALAETFNWLGLGNSECWQLDPKGAEVGRFFAIQHFKRAGVETRREGMKAPINGAEVYILGKPEIIYVDSTGQLVKVVELWPAVLPKVTEAVVAAEIPRFFRLDLGVAFLSASSVDQRHFCQALVRFDAQVGYLSFYIEPDDTLTFFDEPEPVFYSASDGKPAQGVMVKV